LIEEDEDENRDKELEEEEYESETFACKMTIAEYIEQAVWAAS
jgi:hypothetical protein